jgi:DNA-binding CsgD family transcriptional regulator
MQNVQPYARWAFSVHDLPRHDESVTQLLERMFARAGFGLVLVTADRKVIYANDSAKLFMQREVGLRWERGCISATDFKTSRELRSLIVAASREPTEPRQGTLVVIRDPDGVASLAVHVVPLPRQSSPCLSNLEYGIAGLFIIDCQQGSAGRIDVFAEHFGLTSAEARVLLELVTGGGISRAAEKLNLASSTVQSHLKHILEKTGTHRQAELVRVFYETTLPSRRCLAQEKRPATLDTRLVAKCLPQNRGATTISFS